MSDVFTARTNAWRTDMQRGRELASDTAGRVSGQVADPSSVSHACDGCADAMPCGRCGGNIELTHPAYQALAWNLDMFRSKLATASPLIGIATIIENWRNSVLPNDESTRAIERLLGGILSQQTSAIVPVNSRIFADIVDPNGPYWKFASELGSGVSVGLRVSDPAVGEDGMCCPDHIQIPIDLQYTIIETPLEWVVDIQFGYEAEWKPAGTAPEDVYCSCACCEARQFWEFRSSSSATAPMQTLVPDGEDCAYIRIGTNVVGQNSRTSTNFIPAFRVRSGEVPIPNPNEWVYRCAGVRYPDPNGAQPTDNGSYTTCSYESDDHPQFAIPKTLTYYKYESTWTVKILDACALYTERMRAEFKLTYEGVIGPNGPEGDPAGSVSVVAGSNRSPPRSVTVQRH